MIPSSSTMIMSEWYINIPAVRIALGVFVNETWRVSMQYIIIVPSQPEATSAACYRCSCSTIMFDGYKDACIECNRHRGCNSPSAH